MKFVQRENFKYFKIFSRAQCALCVCVFSMWKRFRVNPIDLTEFFHKEQPSYRRKHASDNQNTGPMDQRLANFSTSEGREPGRLQCELVTLKSSLHLLNTGKGRHLWLQWALPMPEKCWTSEVCLLWLKCRANRWSQMLVSKRLFKGRSDIKLPWRNFVSVVKQLLPSLQYLISHSTREMLQTGMHPVHHSLDWFGKEF